MGGRGERSGGETVDIKGPWYVDWVYDDEGHTTGPWETLDRMLIHMANVAALRMQALRPKSIKQIVVRNEDD